MNEEEKQAFEILKGLEFYEYEWYVKTDILEGHANETVERVRKAIEIIVSLINKQQKEIEDLKTITREYDVYELGEGNKIMIANKEWFNNGYFEEHYISKDKIREIITEFIPKSNHEVVLRAKLIKILGEIKK